MVLNAPNFSLHAYGSMLIPLTVYHCFTNTFLANCTLCVFYKLF